MPSVKPEETFRVLVTGFGVCIYNFLGLCATLIPEIIAVWALQRKPFLARSQTAAERDPVYQHYAGSNTLARATTKHELDDDNDSDAQVSYHLH